MKSKFDSRKLALSPLTSRSALEQTTIIGIPKLTFSTPSYNGNYYFTMLIRSSSSLSKSSLLDIIFS